MYVQYTVCCTVLYCMVQYCTRSSILYTVRAHTVVTVQYTDVQIWYSLHIIVIYIFDIIKQESITKGRKDGSVS